MLLFPTCVTTDAQTRERERLELSRRCIRAHTSTSITPEIHVQLLNMKLWKLLLLLWTWNIASGQEPAPVESLKGSFIGDVMVCSSENIYPEPKVSWSPKPAHQTQPQIVKNDNGLYSVSSSASMKLEPPQQFTCNISTENSWKSATYSLNSPVQRSSSVILRCSDSSAPVKSLKWTFKYDQTILTQSGADVMYSDSWRTNVERLSESGDLHLKDLRSEREGVYLCELHTDQHSFFSKTEIKRGPANSSEVRTFSKQKKN
ncbi:hypothetical protein WMY93_015350 [Mugilogobius chulae]|uniref:Ig-like domain-containing protein n=1 Tax=Mugilogobius chulae TaxID=88201 RepID=A0AAW0NU86_9GOBI